MNGDKARFSSPKLKYDFRNCLKFKYQICPANAGRLTVLTYAVFDGMPLFRSPVEDFTTSACGQWMDASVNIIDMSYEHGVSFGATKGSGYGHIRVDDIHMYTGDCL